jgi:hypothetical protein
MDYKTTVEVQRQVIAIKKAINEVIPVGVDVAAIVIALAEIQGEMGRLLYEPEDEDVDNEHC